MKIPATKYPVERFTLDNGLRVVLTPDRSAPVVGVAVVYDVGIRSEPEGRTGFAHLFEHLMFQGSENLEKLAHFRHVQGSGGSFNGSTHLDYTDYFEVLPSNALERALFLEADRMRGPRLTEENLRNQVDVVKEEIRVNVLNRPYGGFPWLQAAAGHVRHVRRTRTTATAPSSTWRAPPSRTRPSSSTRYYACGNAVLAVAGDLDVATAIALIERHFGDVPARPAPVPPRLRRARPDRRAPGHVRRPARPDARAWPAPGGCPTRSATSPATCRTWCSPRCSPTATRPAWSSGWSSATARSPASAATSASWATSSTCATPRRCCCRRTCRPAATWTRCCAPSTRSWTGWPTDGLAPGELARTQARMATHLLRDIDAVLGRALPMAVLEQQRGDAELLNDLPRLVGEVTEAQIVAAAATLRPERRAIRRRASQERTRDWPLSRTWNRPASSSCRSRPSGPSANGLTVIAIRRAAVPLVELRLRVPVRARRRWPAPPCCRQALFTGTSTMSSIDIAAELQAVGGGLAAGLDPDRLLITGNALAAGLDRMLEILAERADRRRRTRPRRSPPSGSGSSTRSRSRRASRPTWPAPRCCERMYGRHPYAVQTPEPEQVRAVRPGAAARAARRPGPPGRRHAGARRRHQPGEGASTPPRRRSTAGPAPAATATCRRPRRSSRARCCWSTGPARCSRRCGWRCPARAAHPRRPRRAAAGQPGLRRLLLVPLVENIREDKGYTYGPHTLDRALRRRLRAGGRGRGGHRGDRPGAAGDRCTSWAGWPASRPSEDELEQARRYALGTLQLGMSTQAGLAGLASMYASFGLRLDYLVEHAGRLAAATRDEVAAVGRALPRAVRGRSPWCSVTPTGCRPRWPP